MTEGDLLTAQEAAKHLRLSISQVYALARSGELASYRFGATVRFDRSDLDAYKAKCRSPATTRAAGTSSLTASLRDSDSALTAYFQKARRGRRPSPSTGAKPPGSSTLRLVASATNP